MKEKVRTWYNAKLMNKVVSEFHKKYPVFDKDTFLRIAENGDIEEVRKLATSIDSYGNSVDYQDKRQVKDKLNDRFADIIGDDLYEIYENLRSSQKLECPRGDESYRLLQIGGCYPYSERKMIKSALYLLHDYVGKQLKLEDIKTINRLYTSGTYWDLIPNVKGDYKLNWEENDDDFNKLNTCRKEQTEAWVSFMNYIINKDYESAYKMMLKYRELCIKEYEREVQW